MWIKRKNYIISFSATKLDFPITIMSTWKLNVTDTKRRCLLGALDTNIRQYLTISKKTKIHRRGWQRRDDTTLINNSPRTDGPIDDNVYSATQSDLRCRGCDVVGLEIGACRWEAPRVTRDMGMLEEWARVLLEPRGHRETVYEPVKLAITHRPRVLRITFSPSTLTRRNHSRPIPPPPPSSPPAPPARRRIGVSSSPSRKCDEGSLRTIGL